MIFPHKFRSYQIFFMKIHKFFANSFRDSINKITLKCLFFSFIIRILRKTGKFQKIKSIPKGLYFPFMRLCNTLFLVSNMWGANNFQKFPRKTGKFKSGQAWTSQITPRLSWDHVHSFSVSQKFVIWNYFVILWNIILWMRQDDKREDAMMHNFPRNFHFNQ